MVQEPVPAFPVVGFRVFLVQLQPRHSTGLGFFRCISQMGMVLEAGVQPVLQCFWQFF